MFGIGFLVGLLTIPGFIFFRGRKAGWDDSNIFKALRVLGHLDLHPGDFQRMRYEDGSKPFWYLNKDEFSEVVKTRPNDNVQKNN